MTFTPSDDELTTTLKELKSKNPTLGISKIHALLIAAHSEWTVSEKRTRKILQSVGLVISNNSSSGANEPAVYPSSKLIPNLDIRKWSTKVEVKYFNKIKGKGLVAVEEIKEGEVIWKEDPFIVAPEWEIYDLQLSSSACGYCTTPLNHESNLTINCPASSSSAYCPARFCNRLCLTRSQRVHPLLCPAQNPASVPLLKWAKEIQWMALHALALTTSRLLLTYNHGDAGEFEKDWHVVKSLAELGMEERAKYSFKDGAYDYTRPTWTKAHKLFVEAFKEPTGSSEKKKLARLLKKPLPLDVESDIFQYDPNFLRGLGRMNLNIESHGGIYTLHSHLNHSCTPNIAVNHLDVRTALARITVTAKEDIKPGEELVVTYVNPKLNVKDRQRELQAWGFGTCRCDRCVEEVKTWKEEERPPGQEGIDDLANELRASFGVM
ncbi:SET domain-containing protein [Pluteus cervinus]|uniref:SET domain-containing protein n=1 Tax=Pluteus cervinus TaxID=181527 RepID=A0ACD3B3K0_9AGAR|nr:SET domain-containing protein [Pluteus cervinus]